MEQSTLEQLEAIRGSNPEVDSLMKEHRSLDEQVEALNEKVYLTPEEDAEMHRLKKEKLRLKDRLESFLQ